MKSLKILLVALLISGCYQSENIPDNDTGTDQVIANTDTETKASTLDNETECVYPELPASGCANGLQILIYQYSYVFKQQAGNYDSSECDTEILVQTISCSNGCKEYEMECSMMEG